MVDEPEAGKADLEGSAGPDAATQITYHYIKGEHFRVIHVDGGLGGITSRGQIHIAFYSEQAAIPREGVRKIDVEKQEIGPEKYTEVPEATVRELEADLIFNEATAIEIRDWFVLHVKKIAQIREAQEKAKGND